MIDPVTLSALASSVATGAASAIGAEMGKDVYRAVSRGLSNGQCRSRMEITEKQISYDELPEDIKLALERRGIAEMIVL